MLTRFKTVFCLTAISLTVAVCANADAEDEPLAVDFENQVATILLRSCITCHNGNDSKAALNLTRHDAALRGGESGATIVPGKPDQSYLIERVVDGSMPPEGKAPPLSDVEIAILQGWIKQGANWPKGRVLSVFERTTEHRAGRDWWSLQPVVRPRPPAVDSPWVRNPIDRFILRKLTENDLHPNGPADRIHYLRRAKFDLLGLPPTIEEADRFVADNAPDAYQRLIDRLLASPHYGERWGRHWLDVVRYTESDGFEHDKFRPHAWRYRDYVIRSLNQDKPYSRFVMEQLAGDAIEPATRDGILATGFLVAGPWDEVQFVGASKNEMRRAKEEQSAEIIGAISQTFLGMTVGCARCHDHKFDPIPQTDYYCMKAVFDGVDHSQGRTAGNRSILTPAEAAANRKQLVPLEQQKQEIAAELAKLDGQGARDATVAAFDDNTIVEGRFAKALNARVTSAKAASKAIYHTPPLTVECWAKANSPSQFNVFVANNLKSSGDHWELYSFAGKGDFSVYMPGYKPAEIRSGVKITDGNWHYLAMRFDGDIVSLFVDGKHVKQQAVTRAKPAGPLGELFIGGYPPQSIGCDGAVDEVRISSAIRPIDGTPEQAFNADEHTVGLWRFDTASDNRFADFSATADNVDVAMAAKKRAELTSALQQVDQQIASLAAPLSYIGFRQQPPPTHVLLRGDIRAVGPQVRPSGLSTIRQPSPDFKLPADAPEAERRLLFARWVADAKNPLTARVMVNRIWQYHFGQGLVRTASDFGFNAGRPSHPELLDWLADEFVRSGWSIKHMHRLIMLSATYRQDSRIRTATVPRSADVRKIDAENRLLWRFSPMRLEGEIVRDAMLAVSGGLNRRMGGPSFQPFKVTVFNTHFYNLFDSELPEYARRTVYRANVITGRDPLLDALDCPAPSVSTPLRRATVTPLQALSLMNDSFVVRQAKQFADRIERSSNRGAEEKIRMAYRMAIARDPTPGETIATRQLIDEYDLASACWALLNSSEFLYVR